MADETKLSTDCLIWSGAARSPVHGRKMIILQGKAPPSHSHDPVFSLDARDPAASVIASHRYLDVEATTIAST